MEKQIQDLYTDPSFPGSLAAPKVFHKQLKKEGRFPGISLKDVDAAISGITAYSLFKDPRQRQRSTAQVVTSGSNRQWQADLIEWAPMIARQNKGYKFLLIAIDVFSKKIYARPIKQKTGREVSEAFTDIFSRIKKIPRKIQTDHGKEFHNATVKYVLDKHGVKHFSTYNTEKAQIVERAIRTIKQKIFKIFQVTGKQEWIDVWPKVVAGYNRTEHSATGEAPDHVSPLNEHLVRGRLYYGEGRHPMRMTRVREKLLKVGEHVRLKKAKSIVEKGYTRKWTTEVFKVTDVLSKEVPPRYKIADLQGESVRGTFYKHELQVVPAPKSYKVKLIRMDKKRHRALIQYRSMIKPDEWVDTGKLNKIRPGDWELRL